MFAISTIPLIDQASNTLVTQGVEFPPILLLGVRLLLQPHALWRWGTRSFMLYKNPRNITKRIAGEVVQQAVGRWQLIRCSAFVTLIALRTFEVAKQKLTLYQSLKKMEAVIQKGRNPSASFNVSREECHRFSLLSCSLIDPQLAGTLLLEAKRLQDFALRLGKIGLEVGWDLFGLSMRYLDAVEAFHFSSDTRKEAVRELFLNSSRLFEELSQNHHHLQEELIRLKPAVKIILEGIGIRWSADQLIDGVGRAITIAQQIHQGATTLSDELHQGLYRGWMGTLLMIGL